MRQEIYRGRDALLMIHGPIRVNWERGRSEPTISGARPGEVRITRSDALRNVAHITIKTRARGLCCCGESVSEQTATFCYR